MWPPSGNLANAGDLRWAVVAHDLPIAYAQARFRLARSLQSAHGSYHTALNAFPELAAVDLPISPRNRPAFTSRSENAPSAGFAARDGL